MNLFFRLAWLRVRALTWGRVSLWDATTISFRVNLADLDLLRHMNNGHYLSLLDLGRIDLLGRAGFWTGGETTRLVSGGLRPKHHVPKVPAPRATI